MKAGDKLIAQQLVWLREVSYDTGADFIIADEPKPDTTKPVEVDPTTAAAWVRQGWAKVTEPVETAPKSAAQAPKPQS